MPKTILCQSMGCLMAICLPLVTLANAGWLDPVIFKGNVSGEEFRWASALGPATVEKVNHDPKGPTLNHDYYQEVTSPTTRNDLVFLVEHAHVNKILPHLKKSFTTKEPMKTGHLKQALREIDYTLGRLVNHPKALGLSSTVCKLLGQPRLPIKYYERALTLYPQRAFTQAQYGQFLVGLGDIDKGIKRLKIAIKLKPKLGSAYGWLAWAYQKKGDKALMVEYAKKAKKHGFKGKLPKVSAEK